MAGTSVTPEHGGGCTADTRESIANDSSAVDSVLDGAGQQADDGVDDDERGQLAAGQDVVADRQLEIDQRRDPLVDALVARADEDEMSGKVGGTLLAEDLADRVEQDDRRVVAVQRLEGGRRSVRARVIIPAPPPYGVSSTDWMPAEPPLAQVMDADGRVPLLLDAPGMLAASGPSIMAGNRVRTSISRVMARGVDGGAVWGDPLGPSGSCRRRLGRWNRPPAAPLALRAAPRGALAGSDGPWAAAGRAPRHRRRSRHAAGRRSG